MDNDEKQVRILALKKRFKRVTAAVLVGAAFVEMVSVAFIRKKK